MEEDNIFYNNINNTINSININNKNPLSIIDEKPELTTLIQATKMEKNDQDSFLIKFLSKFSKGYTFFTVLKITSYSINDTSFILPYCLKQLGIIPFLILLIIITLISLYIYYLIIDVLIKYKLYNNYHKIIQNNTNKTYNIIYYILNIIYHFLILIFENYLYLSLCKRILIFFNINFKEAFYEKIIILSISLIIVEFPFTFIQVFKNPDLIYIIIIFINIVLNIISLIFIIIYKFNNEIELTEVNFFEKFSKKYFICFSLIINIFGWQPQIPKYFKDFKIKTPKRFFKVIYLFFIFQIFLIILICFSNTYLIHDNNETISFLLDYKNKKFVKLKTLQIMAIIFSLLIHIIIAYHLNLIQENLSLILNLTIYKNKGNKYCINKFYSIIFNLFILILSNIGCLFIEDISIIILLYGVFSIIINFICPTITYALMISKNSIEVWLACLISFIVITIGIIGFLLNLFSKQ